MEFLPQIETGFSQGELVMDLSLVFGDCWGHSDDFLVAGMGWEPGAGGIRATWVWDVQWFSCVLNPGSLFSCVKNWGILTAYTHKIILRGSNCQ